MRITSFRIENFRNLRLAECTDPPTFMVICGGNGSGKSALLSALMTAKEQAGAYGNFPSDPRAVAADADEATIAMTIEFNGFEKEYLSKVANSPCPDSDSMVIKIGKTSGGRHEKYSNFIAQLFQHFSWSQSESLGFFDYIDAHRQFAKIQLQTWDVSQLADEATRQTLASPGMQKFQATKAYLVSLKVRDLQNLQRMVANKQSIEEVNDSLEEIRTFFNMFFAPMKFVDVEIDQSPFKFIIDTPHGLIDIDDMSSGEKEVLFTYLRFHQLKHKGAIILFDEADTHLHPDLERRYLEVLRGLAKGNQLWLTTHSPEMMIAAGSASLFTVLKDSPSGDGNQLVRVTENDQLHAVLAEVMGSRGLVSFNQRIVFIEGDDASVDRDIYQTFYPPAEYNVSFVPAGNSATVRKTAEQVNLLLTQAQGFQKYFSIVDGDIERSESDPTSGSRLFKLPVYHVENLLLDEGYMLKATQSLLRGKCPYLSSNEVAAVLKELALTDMHVKAFTKALIDAKVARIAKDAYDAFYQGQHETLAQLTRPAFAEVEQEARELLTAAIEDETWKMHCKGRDLLKAYCNKHGFDYEQFRNLVIEKFEQPPKVLADIMNRILID